MNNNNYCITPKLLHINNDIIDLKKRIDGKVNHHNIQFIFRTHNKRADVIAYNTLMSNNNNNDALNNVNSQRTNNPQQMFNIRETKQFKDLLNK